MTVKKAVLYIFILLLIYAAVVQYNDPDPYIWIPVYLLPAWLLYRKTVSKTDKITYITAGLIYLFWSFNQFPPEWEGLMIDTMKMKTVNIELGRESLGLACCTLFLWVSLFLD